MSKLVFHTNYGFGPNIKSGKQRKIEIIFFFLFCLKILVCHAKRNSSTLLLIQCTLLTLFSTSSKNKKDTHTRSFIIHSLLLLSTNSLNNDKLCAIYQKKNLCRKKEFFAFIFLLRCMQRKCNNKNDNSLNYDILYEMQWLNIRAHGIT